MPNPYDAYTDDQPWSEKIPDYGPPALQPPTAAFDPSAYDALPPLQSPAGPSSPNPYGAPPVPDFTQMGGMGAAPQSQSSLALRQLIQQQENQPPPGKMRTILGAIASAYSPAIGQAIIHPGDAQFNRNYKLLSEQAKLEGDDLDRARQYEALAGERQNRILMRQQADATRQASLQRAVDADRENRTKDNQQTLYSQPGEQIMPAMQLQSPERGVISGTPQGGATLPAVQQMTAPTVPQGFEQVPNPSYNPAGSIQVRKTPAQLATDKLEAQQADWPTISGPLADALGGLGPPAGTKVPFPVWETFIKQATATPDLHFEKTESDNGDVTTDVYNPKTGKKVASVTTKGIGKTKTPPASVTVNSPFGTDADITPDDLKREGQQLAITGQSAQLGNGSKEVKQAILHYKNEFARSSGFTPRDMAVAKAAYAGDTKSLGDMVKSRDNISAFEQTASKNLDQFLDLAKNIPDTGIPWLNKPVRELDANVVGSGNMAAINVARSIANNEIAKVTSGGGLNGVLSDSARGEVAKYNPDTATLPQIRHIAQVLKNDMANRIGSMNNVIGDIQLRTGNMGQPSAPTAAPSGPGRGAPPAPKIGDVAGGYRFKGGNPNDQKNWEVVR